MATPRTTCQLLSALFLAPGLICFASLAVPALHETAFWYFSARWWWTLMFYGGALCIISMLVCQFTCRR